MANNSKSSLNAKNILFVLKKYLDQEKDISKRDFFINSFLQRKEVEVFLPGIISLLKKYKQKIENKNKFLINSATEIDDYIVDYLIQKVAKGNNVFAVETKVDPKLIAGVVVYYDNNFVDASLSSVIAKSFA